MNNGNEKLIRKLLHAERKKFSGAARIFEVRICEKNVLNVKCIV